MKKIDNFTRNQTVRKIMSSEYKSELQLQQQIWLWFYKNYPEFRIPSKSSKCKQPRCLLIHNFTNPRSVVEGAKLASCGLTKGIHDMTLLIPRGEYGALFMELKLPGQKPKDYQIEMIDKLTEMGYYSCYVDSFEEAKYIIKTYLSK